MSVNYAAYLNPELVRTLRVNVTPKRLVFVAGLTLVLLALIAGFQWNEAVAVYSRAERLDYFPDEKFSRYFGSRVFWNLSAVLYVLFFILAPATTALSFVQERLRGTAIFQQMTLLAPLDLALGKFLGSGLLSYVVAAMILPFYFLSASIGNIEDDVLGRALAFLFVGGLSVQAVALYLSTILSGQSERAMRGGLLVGPGVGVLGAIAAFFIYNNFLRQEWRAEKLWLFFNLETQYYVIGLLVLAFAGAWSFAGAVRNVKAAQLIPLSPRALRFFFVTAELLLVGLLWGWEQYSYSHLQYSYYSQYDGLVAYLVFNWIGLLTLAGGLGVRRGRLREWWSAASDPLSAWQRREIKSAVKTFLIALGAAEAGLVALWVSYHMNLAGFPQNLSLATQLFPIAAGFGLTMCGMAAFVQFCGMQQFRIGSWAGVSLLLVFFLLAFVAAQPLKNRDSALALLNPLVTTVALCEGDPWMDVARARQGQRLFIDTDDQEYVGKLNAERRARRPDPAQLRRIVSQSLLAQGLFALSCFALAYGKWRRTRDEVLRESC